MATNYTDQITGNGETVAYKAPCRVATTANIALSGLLTIDGVALAVDDRVLVKNQTDARQNGIYIANTGPWQRARDFDSRRDVTRGTQVFVTDGSTNGRTGWSISSAAPISVGSSTTSFQVSEWVADAMLAGIYDPTDKAADVFSMDNMDETSTAKVMTSAERTKLASIDAGAEVNTVTSVAGKIGDVLLDKSDVGLGNVANTSDFDKPLSNAAVAALMLKADKGSPGALAVPVVLNHSASVAIGNASGATPNLQVHGTGTESGTGNYRWTNSNAGPSVSLIKSRGAAVGSRAIVADGDQVGTIAFHIDDAVNFPPVANIRAEVDGTPGAADAPGRLLFLTTSDGGVVLAERMRISSSGAITMSSSLAVTGALSKGSGTFLIDHPLDPCNRDLAHGFVEAPRYELIYRGVVRLVAGRATVSLDADSNPDHPMTPGTFAALTTNARVLSLQNQDGFARLRPGPIVGGVFEVICEDEDCTDEVAWLVIAERNDPFVKSDLDLNTDADGRFMPERDKLPVPETIEEEA